MSGGEELSDNFTEENIMQFEVCKICKGTGYAGLPPMSGKSNLKAYVCQDCDGQGVIVNMP